MKIKLIGLVFSTLIILGVYALYTLKPHTLGPKHSAQNSATIRLGVTVPLSGDYATYGKLIQDGVELAARDLKNEGLALEVYYEDVPTPGTPAVTAVRKLISANKIHGIAANFWNPAIPLMANDINRAKIPSFHTAAADDLILDAGDYIFSTNTKIKDEAKQLANYASQQLKAKSASVIYISTTFGENYSEHFQRQFKHLGGNILYNETTLLGDVDLRGVLSRAKKGNPDVIFAAYFGTNLGIVLKQARELGIDIPILSVYEAEDPSVLKTAGNAANGVRFFISEPLDDTAKRIKLKTKFEKHFGYTPRILGRNAYDATVILAKALSECRLESECTKNRVYQLKNYSGFSGDFDIDPDGAAQKKFALKTIDKGKFVRVPED